MSDRQKHLHRSRGNKVIAGICGGLGEYLGVDANIVRLFWVVLSLMGGSGIVLYVLAYFIMPPESYEENMPPPTGQLNFTAIKVFGAVFIIAGMAILFDNLNIFSFHHWWHFSREFFFPGILIILGLYFIMKKDNRFAETVTGSETGNSAPNPNTQNPEDGPKTLRRSVMDKKLFGVCGGIAEYFNVDSAVVRILFAVFTVFTSGSGILIYLLMVLIIPEGIIQLSDQK
jgi:phage shock protein C